MINPFSKYISKKQSGKNIYLRKQTVDQEVYDYVFVEKYHRPFRNITNPNPVILDLGANIGLTIVDLKIAYPGAKIYAFEMDVENYELAKRNCKSLQDVFLFNKAIWYKPGMMKYDKSVNADAYKIDGDIGKQGKIQEVEAETVEQVIKENKLSSVDYLKMDIEGAELEIFKEDLQWLHIVKQIKIEVHYGAEVLEMFISKLKQFGFEAVKDTQHWSTVIGYKNEG